MESGEDGLHGEIVACPVTVELKRVIDFAKRELLMAENVLVKGSRRKSAILLSVQVNITFCLTRIIKYVPYE